MICAKKSGATALVNTPALYPIEKIYSKRANAIRVFLRLFSFVYFIAIKTTESMKSKSNRHILYSF